jgi:hypothetical protein
MHENQEGTACHLCPYHVDEKDPHAAILVLSRLRVPVRATHLIAEEALLHGSVVGGEEWTV